MALTNTADSYGSVTKFFHWATALLILTVIPLGVIAHNMSLDPETLGLKATLFSAHKTVGVAIFFLALARILWALSQPKPAPVGDAGKVQHWLAETVHWLLYGSLVLVPLTGWIQHSASTGYAPIWWPFGQNLPFVPLDEGVAQTFAGLHMVFERVMVASLLLHVVGALKHHFFDKDATLRRMWIGGGAATGAPRPHRPALPIAGALTAWALAVGLGASLGAYSKEIQAAQIAQLEAAPSGWTVQEGSLGITVTQFGNSISGGFDEWVAAIEFSETPDADGVHGTVKVQIAIGSLTLGSTTQQALGADWFNAAGFPTATFAAQLIQAEGEDAYIADGTLTLKGAAVPVTLPFTLQITDGVAQMSGNTTLARRDFGIGGDDTTVGYDVAVTISLTATEGDADINTVPADS